MNWKRPIALKRVIKKFFQIRKKSNVGTNSAALAFFATFAILPLSYLIVLSLGIFLKNEQARVLVLQTAEEFITPSFLGLLEAALSRLSELQTNILSNAISIISLVVAVLFFVLKLEGSISSIVGTGGQKLGSLTDRFRSAAISVFIILCLAVLIASKLVVTSLTSFIFSEATLFGELPSFIYLGMQIVISTVFAAALLAAPFYLFAQKKASWKMTIEAAFLTAALLSLGDQALALLLSQSFQMELFGASGALIALLLWVYYNGQIFLSGLAYFKARIIVARPKDGPV